MNIQRPLLVLGATAALGLAVFGLIRGFVPDIDPRVSQWGFWLSGCALAGSLALYTGTLIVRTVRRGVTRCGLALIFLHSGLLISLSGIGLDEAFGLKGSVFIREGTSAQTWFDDEGSEHPLPFAVACEDFRLSVYPGTYRVSDYATKIVITDENSRKPVTLRVNEPILHEGFRLYQQDYGIEPGPEYHISVSVEQMGRVYNLALKPGERRAFGESGSLITVLDFSPSLAFKDGEPHTFNDNAMLNPGYLIRLEERGGESSLQWLTPYQTPKTKMGETIVTVHDFWGIEYTEIALVKSPGRHIVIGGALLASLGIVLLFLSRRKP